jgi:hypothetical protein
LPTLLLLLQGRVTRRKKPFFLERGVEESVAICRRVTRAMVEAAV